MPINLHVSEASDATQTEYMLNRLLYWQVSLVRVFFSRMACFLSGLWRIPTHIAVCGTTFMNYSFMHVIRGIDAENVFFCFHSIELNSIELSHYLRP